MTRLILCRHGETEYNLLELCTGQTDISLSSKGKSQADALGCSLEQYGPDIILCSTLLRARETAAAVQKHLGCSIEYHEQLKEQNFGKFEGQGIENYFAAAESSTNRFEDFKGAGGESFSDVVERVNPFISTVTKRFSGRTVVIITHGSVIRALLSSLRGIEFDQDLLLPGSFRVVDLQAS